MVTSVKVQAPSSTANLGPGFDVFGLALNAFHDEITLTKKPWHGIRILTVDEYDFENERPILWTPTASYRVNSGTGSEDEGNKG